MNAMLSNSDFLATCGTIINRCVGFLLYRPLTLANVLNPLYFTREGEAIYLRVSLSGMNDIRFECAIGSMLCVSSATANRSIHSYAIINPFTGIFVKMGDIRI
ncbi:hypothetical protein KI387_041859, partial [Taxus chinensis]